MNLRERAAMAYLDRRLEQENDLTRLASRAMSEILGQSELEFGAVTVNPSGTSLVELEADGVAFVVKVTTTTVVSSESNKGMSWDEDKVVVQCRHGGKEHMILSLADLGQVFKDEFKDEPVPTEPETKPEPEAV